MGGIERTLVQTTAWLSVQGCVEPVAACCENTPLYRQLRANGVKVYGLPNHPLFSKSFLRTLDIVTFLKLFKILKTEKPDVVHVHIGLVENLLLKMLGYPVVYTFHGYGTLFTDQATQSPLKRLFKQLTKGLFQKTAQQVDALLFVSRAEQLRMLTEGYFGPHPDADRIGEVLHNGLAIADLQEQAARLDSDAIKRELDIPARGRCVTYINRLDGNKNPEAFLRLAQRLTAQDDNLYYLIAGDGPLAQSIEAACQNIPNARFLGYLSNIVSVLAASDLAVYPAVREGFGMSLVEAMALGVPCIAYANGGSAEILGMPDTQQCLVPVDDEPALYKAAEAILYPSSEQAIRQLRQSLVQRASDFDSTAYIERLNQVYQRLTPLISVILPVYNGQDLVLRAVYSVLNQTYPHLELIVVDDGSSDETLQRLATVQDHRLRILTKSNQGVAAARNKGFRAAQGSYIAFIDADDIWLTQKLSREVCILRENHHPESPGCLVYSPYYAVDEQDRLIHLPGIYRDQGDLSEAVLANEGIFLPSTTLIHRVVFETVGGFKSACYHEDRVFFIEACQRFPAFPTRERLVIYRQSLSGRSRAVLAHYDDALKAELSIVETLRDTLANARCEMLLARQKRNLIFRFLMYDQMRHAQRLFADSELQKISSELWQGKKAKLALLSLKTGVNFLTASRWIVQSSMKLFLGFGWGFRIRNLHLSPMPCQATDSLYPHVE